MKRTKNAARLLTLLLVLCMVFLPLVACKTRTATPANQNQQQNSGSQEQDPPIVAKNCTVVLEKDPLTVYIVDVNQVGTIDQGLVSIFEYLKNTEEGFDYEVSNGWTNKVGPIEYDSAAKKSPYYWTSVETDQSATPYYQPKEYNGIQLIEAGKGPDQMTIQADAIYYIGVVTW